MSLQLPKAPLSRPEFIALMGMLMAFVAFSIDAMLPAIGRIGADLSPLAPLQAKLVVPVFLIGLGTGTIFTGPLSDALGRRPVVISGATLYCLGAAMAWSAPSLEWLLVARFVQGVGASGARVVALAIIRDCYSGREMARITSLVIMVFTLVPAIAPSIGAFLMWITGWRGIFAAFLFFAIAIAGWFLVRQPETLPPERRRALNLQQLQSASMEVLGHPLVCRAIAVQVLCYSILFTMLSVTQPIFALVLGAGDTFHFWFGAIVIVAIAGPMMNARLVVRHGMHRIIWVALALEVGFSLLYLAGLYLDVVRADAILPFFLWQAVAFAMAGMTLGNLNALALEPMGHIAGTASSLITAIATIGGALLAIPAAGLFEDSQVPVIWAVLGFAAVGCALLTSRAFVEIRQPA